MSSFLERMVGGRTCSFEASAPKVDATVVVHEVRSVELGGSEKVCVSVRDLNRRDSDSFADLGAAVQFKSLELDTNLSVKVWASREDVSAAVARGEFVEKRNCGEIQIPVQKLIMKFGGMLYQTWLMLDNPGLKDSVSSTLMASVAGEDYDSFEQALQNAPRQLFQPKICISIIKTEDVGSSGRVVWKEEAPTEQRGGRWASLLRSQQQHAIMCTTQHLNSNNHFVAQMEQALASSTVQIESLQEREQRQAEIIAKLKEQLGDGDARTQEQSAERSGRESQIEHLRAQVRRCEAELAQEEAVKDDLEATLQAQKHGHAQELAQVRGAQASQASVEGAAQREANKLKSLMDRQAEEINTLQEDLRKVGEEANKKIDSANDRIRALRKDKEEAVEGKNQMQGEFTKLLEQKEALLKIVEDLHQTCEGNGLGMAGRQSIDSITNFRQQ